MRLKTLLFAIALILASTAYAQFELCSIFTDNMVLQRDTEIPIWGWTNERTPMKVTFRGQTYEVNIDDQGKWQSKLPATAAGGTYEIIIEQGGDKKMLKNILFGDVWVCSGQSNMEWTIQNSMRAEEEIANAHDPQIRHFKVVREGANFPEDRLDGEPWQVASSETLADFTAVGYFFAKELRDKVGVPIGLLNSSWGGSRVEPWMSAEALGYGNAQSAGEILKKRQKERAEKQEKQLKELLGEIPTEDKGLMNGEAKWAAIDYEDASWETMELPNLWEGQGLEGVDGIVWYRKSIQLSPQESRKNITLYLGKIDDSDITWVNGQKVGEMEQKYNTNRVYEIPSSVLKAGDNIITVRVEDTGGGGGLYGDDNGEMAYVIDGKKVDLSGSWKYKVAKVELGSMTAGLTNHTPMLLYNKMIHPILDFPIKGVIWYQGESNASPSEAFEYRDLFSDMIVDWRKRWNTKGDFPFLFVQLANFMAPSKQPTESGWATLRESQSATLKLPNTAQAVIIDIGEADDIHPRNKHDVGYRLSLGARKFAYGEDELVHSGPTYKKMKRRGKKIVLQFDHVGSGLVAKSGELEEFAIAGADKAFVWAKAKIKKDKVIVWNETIKKPVAVRYAWANNPDKANLYNKEGLPTSPFRTDKW
ncbi:MAG: sialate O-acetylesterase [Bacteroidota bacterium]